MLECMKCGDSAQDLFRQEDIYVCCTCKYGSRLTKRSIMDPMNEEMALATKVRCISAETLNLL